MADHRSRIGDRREEMYAATLGVDALERQRRLGLDYRSCCGEHKQDPHHITCKFYVADMQPTEIEGQGSLI